uniref:PCI domain-containing protein n=1 Tax=Chlamydomonas leiostraca TaxID=1034604 RepID=A0A7S0S2D0_9CHLO
MCARLGPLVAKLGELSPGMSGASPVKDVNLGMYVNSLKQVALLRLLKQLSEVYSTMRVQSLAELVSFMPLSEVEAVVVDAVKNDFLQVRIDHRNGTLHFGSQQLESGHVRNHLAQLTQRLSKAVHMMQPEDSSAHAARRSAAIKTALDTMDKEHKMSNARKIMIEKRKEEAELAMLEAEKEAELRRQTAAREAEMAEEKRRREEALRREKERIERELEEREQEEARALLEANKKKLGAKGGKLDQAAGLDKRTLVAEVLTERMKEAQEMERRMQKLAKQLDHLERARREEEAPLLKQLAVTRMEDARKQHAEQQTADAARHRAQWESDTADKARLAITLGDKEAFKAQIVARREEEFEELRRLKEEVYQKRLEEKRRARHQARIQAYAQRCFDTVKERMDEIEAEERRAEEERRAAEEEELQRKAAEEAERQRARLAELDQKAREERPAPAAASTGNRFVPSALRSKAGDSSGGGAPPAARGGDDDDRWARRDAAPPAARGGDDRWGRRDEGPAPAAGRYAPPTRRDDGPPPRRDEAPPAPRPAAPAAAPASAGGKFVPPHLRNRQ